MSYNVSLCDEKGEVLRVDGVLYLSGGTYAVDGTNECKFNITYNYSKLLCDALESERGIYDLVGRPAKHTVAQLYKALSKLTPVHPLPFGALVPESLDEKRAGRQYDYWYPSEANAHVALRTLLTLADLQPDGIWHVD